MTLKIALAQTNFLVGDIAANVDNIARAAIYARDELGAELVVFPELTITGYPAEDLLLRADFIAAANNALYQLADRVADIALVVGFPERAGDKLYNSAAVLHQGAITACYRKRAQPNYGVFDEQRVSFPSSSPHVYTQVFRFTILGVWERVKIDEICGSGHPAANNRALFAAGWPLPQLMYNDESSSLGTHTLKLCLP